MRPDLQFLEQVDNYLSGHLSASDKLAFENTLNQNPELNEVFETQKQIIQAAKRKALMKEIEGVAIGFGGTSWIAMNAKWILSILVVGIITTSAVFLFSEDNNTELTLKQQPLGDSTNKTLASVSNDTNETEKAEVPDGFTPIENEDESEDDYTVFAVGSNFSFFPTFREFNKVQAEVINQDNELADNSPDLELVETEGKINSKIYNRSAAFPEGNLALKKFINLNLNYPLEAAQKRIEGNVKVDFVVGKNGEISEVEAQCFNLAKTHGEFTEPFSALQMFFNKKIAKAFEDEALRMLEIMPNWIYATNNRGNAVESNVRLYFDFNYPSETLVYQLEESTEKKNKSGGWKYQ